MKLFKNGTKIDVFKANNDGDTPMLWACIKGSFIICVNGYTMLGQRMIFFKLTKISIHQ